MSHINEAPTTKNRSFRRRIVDDGPLVVIGSLVVSARRRLARPFSNQLLVSSVLASALALAGFASLYLGWRGTAASLAVGLQLAYLVSGGLAGFALLATGVGLLLIQFSRHLAAKERALVHELLDESLLVLERTRAISHESSERRETTMSRVSAELK